MTKDNVFKAVESELDYQDAQWGKQIDTNKSVESFMVYMKHYLDEAFRSITVDNNDENAKEMLRKVVAIGVKCGIVNGMPSRGVNTIDQSVGGKDQNMGWLMERMDTLVEKERDRVAQNDEKDKWDTMVTGMKQDKKDSDDKKDDAKTAH